MTPDPPIAVLRAAAYRRTRWKNGGGETREIAIGPAGAGLDDFDWRISMATVASDGPFSTFPGVDRTLCILNGAGIELCIADTPAHRLTDTSEPFAFSGDSAARSTLIGGAVTDFNVMTRRHRVDHTVQRIQLRAGETRDLQPDVFIVFCQSGVVSVESFEAGEIRVRLEPLDTMLRHATGSTPGRVRAESAAIVCVVTIAAREGER